MPNEGDMDYCITCEKEIIFEENEWAHVRGAYAYPITTPVHKAEPPPEGLK